MKLYQKQILMLSNQCKQNKGPAFKGKRISMPTLII